jgi:hypothetical protein
LYNFFQISILKHEKKWRWKMKKVVLILGLILLLPLLICAQELDATVTVNSEQLATAERERVENFGKQIQDYLNNSKFTNQAWDGERIKCSFTIVFQNASDEITYTAQLVVASQRPIYGTKSSSKMFYVLDNQWQFKYEKNQAMYFNQSNFDPLTSFLDFYAYLIIGLDTDSFYSLGGTDYFQKALDITAKGGASQYAKGWQTESSAYNRRTLIDNLLNSKYQVFRQDYFNYHYNGIDLLASSKPEMRQMGINNIVRLIRNLDRMKDQVDWRSVLLRVFFDAKAVEMAEILRNYPDKTIYDSLKRIDPSHTTKYDEARQ